MVLMLRFYQMWVAPVPWAMIVRGASIVYVGRELYRMHAWAANVGTGQMAEVRELLRDRRMSLGV